VAATDMRCHPCLFNSCGTDSATTLICLSAADVKMDAREDLSVTSTVMPCVVSGYTEAESIDDVVVRMKPISNNCVCSAYSDSNAFGYFLAARSPPGNVASRAYSSLLHVSTHIAFAAGSA